MGKEQLLLERAVYAFGRETGLPAQILQLELPLRTGRERTFPRPDAQIQVEGPLAKHKFAVEMKRTGADRFEVINQLRLFWPQKRKPALVLVAPYITTAIAEKCKEIGLLFMDTAGNAYLQERDLYVYVVGKKRTEELQRREDTRLNNAAGLKLMFALLCQPHLLNETYREIARVAKVALGTVGQVMKELEAKRLLTNLGAGPRRKLVDPGRLIQDWVAYYPANLRPKQNPRRFQTPELDWRHRIDLTRFGAYWGGETAGEKLTTYLAPETLTIYARENPKKLITQERLRADVNGNVDILDAFWHPNLDAKNEYADVVPPLLAYADLMTTTDSRNLETARIIYGRYIAPNL